MTYHLVCLPASLDPLPVPITHQGECAACGEDVVVISDVLGKMLAWDRAVEVRCLECAHRG